MPKPVTVITLLIGSLLYFGSTQKALAQSTTHAIVNATGCTVANAQTCNVTVNWPVSFVDNNYAVMCTVTSFVTSNGGSLGQTLLQITGQTPENVTTSFRNNQGITVNTTISCIGVHN
jgi:hypothetical protein